MRSWMLLSAILPLAACTDIEVAAGPSPTVPVFAFFNDPSRVDTDGTPDLIVDGKQTEQHWLVRDENLPANFCSVIEGGVTPGYHRVLRFTVMTPNVGDADVFVGSPLAHYEAGDDLFEFASCHNHFHFRHYATYKLIDAKTGYVWRAAKRGFCMLDTDPWNTQTGDGNRNYWNCGTLTRDGFQGISDGWADTYRWDLGGQYFVLDGGDGQAAVPPGSYYIEVEVNPAFAPKKNKACPRVTDPATGLCHQFAESNYANNTTRVLITIPSHVGRAGWGPLKDAAEITTEVPEHTT